MPKRWSPTALWPLLDGVGARDITSIVANQNWFSLPPAHDDV